MNNSLWNNAVGVLKASTLKILQAKVGRQGCLTVDGWAATNRKQVKAWEADGSLLQRAQEAGSQAQKASRLYEADKAANQGLAALAQFEINELYGGPDSRL